MEGHRIFNQQLPINEPERLQALHSLGLLDTPREERFDRLASMMSLVFNCPNAMINLVGEERLWIKSDTATKGELNTHPRMASVCSLTILNEGLLVLEDAGKDERLSKFRRLNPGFNIGFYAGAPLKTRDGFAVGSACVWDHEPRPFSERDQQILASLAEVIADELQRPAEGSSESFDVNGDLVTVCAWSNRVHHQGRWIPSGQYLQHHLGMRVTHGMAEDLTEQFFDDIENPE